MINKGVSPTIKNGCKFARAGNRLMPDGCMRSLTDWEI